MERKKIIGFVLFLSLGVTFGCSQLVEVGKPQNQLVSKSVFDDSVSVNAAMANIYTLFSNNIQGNYGINIHLYSDEYTFTGGNNEFNISTITPSNSSNNQIWSNLYLAIYSCNDIIERLPLSSSIAPSFRTKSVNEAKFLRAYAYFYLQNLYGNIPLLLTTDITQNKQAIQSDSTNIYQQILADLEDATHGLSENHLGGGKVRATKWAAKSLLARTYLYLRNWQEAKKEANDVIQSGRYSLSRELDETFLANSDEAILQLWTPNGFIRTTSQLIPASSSILPLYNISSQLLDAFEQGDKRKDQWIGVISDIESGETYYYPQKYKNRTTNTINQEYVMMLRLVEQYLIRAESEANLGNVKAAIADLNFVRERAGLKPVEDQISKDDCIALILRERRVEMFGEWGHRFFDLKRSGLLDEVMTKQKATWRIGIAQYLPIPENEITYNSNIHQNKGY